MAFDLGAQAVVQHGLSLRLRGDGWIRRTSRIWCDSETSTYLLEPSLGEESPTQSAGGEHSIWQLTDVSPSPTDARAKSAGSERYDSWMPTGRHGSRMAGWGAKSRPTCSEHVVT